MTRAACYARFSSDLQRETSLVDQIETARRYAEGHSWSFLSAHIYTDAAISGASLERPGIQALRAAVARKPLPFDILLVDDSSRVSRDLADAVRLLQELRFAGVRVIYISQNIDSANEQAETLVAVHGVVDSLYLREMAKKIKRGLAGQIGRGYSTGSITFGYRTVPVEDPSGKMNVDGHAILLGKRGEIVPAEARTVVRIFELYAGGFGTSRILETLRREGLRGPRGARWKAGAIKRVLENEKYRGRLIWGQRTSERRPGTRQLVQRAVPREQWHVQERPELCIVSEELWKRVEERRREVRRALTLNPGRPLMRGRNAALHSRHLFSGFMTCASCGGAVVVVTGGHGSPRYGCLRSWKNGTIACTNRLTVRAKLADTYLLEGLRSELVSPATLRYITEALATALNKQIDERPRLLTEARTVQEHTRQRLQRLVEAIENGVHPATLASAIGERQADLARLDAAIAELAEPVHQRLAVLPSWVRTQLEDLRGLLGDTPDRVKMEFQRLATRVTMTPVEESGTRFYRAVVVNSLACLSGMTEMRAFSATAVDRLDHR